MNKKAPIIIAILGNSLGIYNTSLYGFFALLLAPAYFPLNNPLISHIAALSAFAVGFLARPFGGIIFGYIGDTYGRKKSFTFSILLTTLATFVIGVLPSYEVIGILAPLILVCCLAVQGSSLLGVYTGASLLIAEYSKQHKVGFVCSVLPASSLIGIGAAASLGAIVTLDAMPAWAWRIPFLFSVIVGILIFFLRHSIVEAPAFKEADSHQRREEYPLVSILKNHRRNFFCTIGVNIAATAFFYIPMMYSMSLSAISQKYLSPHQSMLVNAEMMIIAVVLLPLMGYISDKIGIKRLMQYGSMATIVVALPLFLFLHQDISVTKVAISMFLFSILYTSYAGPMGAFLVYLFLPQERYTGLGLGTALGGAISGASTSLLILLLMRLTDNGTALALYVMFCGGIGWLSVSKALLVVGSSQRDQLGPNNYETELLVKEA